ncbi:MAG: translocation/assembly module TamB domain-containing protein [Deltaproteobacteria bacterium]|nr:translocation/assembly module TamB domain-containing protein [Myxococcales bacterium]MDP3216307.1 translocation/assembly module TamB domain-containing protein [Deltaproteobacteria bacterium]
MPAGLSTALGILARLVALPILLAIALVLHLPTGLGRAAATDIARAAAADFAPGHFTFRRIARLDPGGLVVEGLTWRDLDRRALVEDATVTVTTTVGLLKAVLGSAPWPAIAVDARVITAFVPRLPSEPPPPPGTTRPEKPLPEMRFSDLRLRAATLRNTLGYPIEARDVRLSAGVRILPAGVNFNLRSLSLQTTTTPLSPVSLQARARGRTYPALSVDAGLTLTGAPLRCAITVVPQANTETLVTLRDCFVPGATLTQLAAMDPAQTLPDVSIPNLAAHGRLEGSWNVDGRVVIGRAATTLTAFIGSHDRRATLRFDRVVLRDAYSALPDGQIDGAIVLTAQDIGDGQRVTVDARAFHALVSGNEVPPFVVTAVYRERQPLTIEALDVPMVRLHATGTVGLDGAHPIDLQASFEPPPLETLPWTRDLARGRVRGTAHVTGVPANLRVDATVLADALAVGSARIRHGELRGAFVLAGAAQTVDAVATLQGVSVRGAVQPSDATVRVEGNPAGVLRVRASANGPGLLAALGAAPEGVPANASVQLDASVDLSDPAYISTRINDARFNLRGASARLRGSLAVRPSSPITSLRGALDVDAGASGSIAVALGNGRLSVNARRFDLAWAAPLAPPGQPLSGHIDGRLVIDLANVVRSEGALTLRALTVPGLGVVTADLSLTRRDRELVARINAALTPPGSPEAATVTLEAITPPVRAWSDPDAWARGLRTISARGEIADLGNFPLLAAALPRTLRMQGRLVLTANVSRPTAAAPLAGTVGVEGRGLVVGVGIPSLLGRAPRMVPAVEPMWVRGVLCASLASLRPDDISPRLRLALARDFDEPSPGPPPGCDDEPLMPRTLVATDVTLRGPWQTALVAVREALQLRDAPLPGRLRAALAAASTDARLSLGPILRSEWPLRTVAIPQADGTPRFIRPPDVPAGTMLHAEVRATGSFLVPSVEVEVEGSAPTLPIVGLDEPVRADIFAAIAPREGGTLLDAWAVNLNVRGLTSPNTTRDQQARLEADIRLSTRVADLSARGSGGLSWDRFDVDTENLRIERIRWARERGLEGRVAVRLLATDDPRQPVTADVTVSDFRARLPESLQAQSYVAPSVRARIHAAMRNERGRLQLRTCAIATTAAAPPDCSPDGPVPEAPTESVLVIASMPFTGTLPRVQPDRSGAVLDLIAVGYPLETLSRFVPDDLASNLGGQLQAQVHWDGQHPNSPSGQIALRGGTATLTSLGEPMRELDLLIDARDSRVRVDHIDFALGRGRLHAEGGATIGADHVEMNISGRATTLPAVLSGYTWAWLDGSVDFNMDFRSDGARGRIEIERLSALVQDQPSNNLQDLSADPNVFIVGRTQLAQPGDVSNYPIEIEVHSQTPVWARRSDFAIAIRTDLRIRKDRAGLAISGTVNQASNQSWYSIFGKQFDLDRVRITFDGNLAMNPDLDIAAHHDSPSAGRITVAVSGRLQRPTIVLTSESFPTASQAEILAMIALGRRSPAASSSGTDFAGQFAQAIVSLVSGIVASGISREFAFLPTIIAEPTTTGSGGGRYGAGVNLSPRIYIQATYSAAGSSSSASTGTSNLAAEFRLLFEYAISEAITFAASGSSRGAGSADVFWSP